MPLRTHATVLALGLLGGLALTQSPPAFAAPSDATAQQAAAPTDKEHCQNGGWRRFTNPTFTNQGDCVSYVNSLTPADAGSGAGVNLAATPELSSVALFGSGAAALSGYALLRLRTRRGRR